MCIVRYIFPNKRSISSFVRIFYGTVHKVNLYMLFHTDEVHFKYRFSNISAIHRDSCMGKL